MTETGHHLGEKRVQQVDETSSVTGVVVARMSVTLDGDVGYHRRVVMTEQLAGVVVVVAVEMTGGATTGFVVMSLTEEIATWIGRHVTMIAETAMWSVAVVLQLHEIVNMSVAR